MHKRFVSIQFSKIQGARRVKQALGVIIFNAPMASCKKVPGRIVSEESESLPHYGICPKLIDININETILTCGITFKIDKKTG